MIIMRFLAVLILTLCFIYYTFGVTQGASDKGNNKQKNTEVKEEPFKQVVKQETKERDVKVMITDADKYASDLINKGENANLMEAADYMTNGSKAKRVTLKEMIQGGWKLVAITQATKLEYILIFVKE